jgi:hypothetical protein
VAQLNIAMRVYDTHPVIFTTMLNEKNKSKDNFGGTHQFTTQPINLGAVHAAGPEFVGYQEARMMFGLSRTHLYKLGKEGLIRTVSLRGRGTTRGRRLYSVDSIRAFLNASVD